MVIILSAYRDFKGDDFQQKFEGKDSGKNHVHVVQDIRIHSALAIIL